MPFPRHVERVSHVEPVEEAPEAVDAAEPSEDGEEKEKEPFAAEWTCKYLVAHSTVDGSEIRRSPVEGTVVYPSLFLGFHTSQVLVQDFSHQQ